MRLLHWEDKMEILYIWIAVAVGIIVYDEWDWYWRKKND